MSHCDQAIWQNIVCWRFVCFHNFCRAVLGHSARVQVCCLSRSEPPTHIIKYCVDLIKCPTPRTFDIRSKHSSTSSSSVEQPQSSRWLFCRYWGVCIAEETKKERKKKPLVLLRIESTTVLADSWHKSAGRCCLRGGSSFHSLIDLGRKDQPTIPTRPSPTAPSSVILQDCWGTCTSLTTRNIPHT